MTAKCQQENRQLSSLDAVSERKNTDDGATDALYCRVPHAEVPVGQLIWLSTEMRTYYEHPENSWCRFRRTFTLGCVPMQGDELQIFAGNRYALFINGTPVGRGPCRSDPRWQYYDTYHIAPYLKPGKNVIAVLCLYYGFGTGQSCDRIPCLFVRCTLSGQNAPLTLHSDNAWRAASDPSHPNGAPRINGCKGCIEVLDNRHAEEWTLPAYDDSAWSPVGTRDAALSPYWNLAPRPVAPLVYGHTEATEIVLRGSGYAYCHAADTDMHLKIKRELADADLRVCLETLPTVVRPGMDGTCQLLTVRFPHLSVGYCGITVQGHEGDTVDIVYSEMLLNGRPDFNAVSYRAISRFILRDGKNEMNVLFDYEAFCYLTLIVRAKEPVTVLGISCETCRAAGDFARFTSENKRLNQLWDISAYTLSVSRQDGYLDSPSREQQQWMADGRIQGIADFYATGDDRMFAKLLLQIGQSIDFEGMTTSRYPDENHNYPPIPSFCLHWICALTDFHRLTGKTEPLRTLYPNALLAIRWFSAFLDGDGLLTNVPYWQYYDLGKNESGQESDFGCGGENGYLNALYLGSLQSIIHLATLFGDTRAQAYFRRQYSTTRDAFQRLLWSEKRGAYADCRVGNNLSSSVSESVNALAILHAHDAGDARIPRIVFSVFASDNPDIVRVSVPGMALLSEALLKAEESPLCIRLYLARYGTMLDSGTDTTWEHWNVVERDRTGNAVNCSSTCHGWGASPIIMIARHILHLDTARNPGIPDADVFSAVGKTEWKK